MTIVFSPDDTASRVALAGVGRLVHRPLSRSHSLGPSEALRYSEADSPPVMDAPSAPGGYKVVAAVFVLNFVMFGCAFSISTFFRSLNETFVASHAALALLYSIGIGLYYFIGIVTGPLADRHGPRPLVLTGIVIIVFGLLCASQAHAFWQLVLCFGLGIGVGIGCCYVPALSAALSWFPHRCGMVSGFVASGMGVGTLLVPIAIDRLIHAEGWRMAFVALALLNLLGGGAAALLIKRQTPPPAAAQRPLFTKRLLGGIKTRQFRFIFGAGLCASLGYQLPFAHIVDYAEQKGIPDAISVTLLGLIGVGSIAGRLLGWVGDWFGSRRALAGFLFATTATLAYWPLAQTPLQIGMFTLLFGACYGGIVALTSPLVSEHLPESQAGGLSSFLGLCLSSVGIGSFVGPLAASFIHDVCNSYTMPIYAGGLFTFLSAILVLLLSE